MADPAPSDGGFTLLELLVAMALLGLLTMAMFGGLHFGVQVWARTDHAVADARMLRRVETTLASDIAQAYPFFSNGGGKAQIAFDGTAESLRYLTASTNLKGALDEVTIAVKGEAGDLDLTRRAGLELSPQGAIQNIVLLSHLRSVAFAYFGADEPGAAPVWAKEWRERTRLPALVRIRLQQADGRWQQMVFAPRLAADAGCSFDPLTKYCRGR